MKLNEMAKIRTGLVLNRKIHTPEDKFSIKYRQLTLKAIMPEGMIDLREIDDFVAKEILKPDYFTKKGDVIVRLSYPYTAVIIDESTQGLLVPSHFIIIKCNTKKIFSGYLQWLLNSEKMQKKISMSTTTTGFGTIKSSFFSDLEIYQISMKNQEMIAELNSLSLQEGKLLMKLKEEKQRYYSAVTYKLQKEMRKN